MAAPQPTGFEDLAPHGVTGFEDLAPTARSLPERVAAGLKIGVQGGLSNVAGQVGLAGVDAATKAAEWLAPTEQPEGVAGKLAAAAGNTAVLLPEFFAAAAASTALTGTPLPGITAAGALSGAAGAPEGERLKGAAIGGATGLVLGGAGKLVNAAPWAVRALVGAAGGGSVSAAVDVAEGRPIDVENAAAQTLLFGGLGAIGGRRGAASKDTPAKATGFEDLATAIRKEVTVEPERVPAPPVVEKQLEVRPATPEEAASPAEPPPTNTIISSPALPTVEIPLEKLSLSPDVPNFKTDARSDTGVVPGEELGGSYERRGTAPIVVWERTDGRLEVITGRHRLDLARRNGEPTIPAQVLRESAGFDQADALRFDAESNIRDGQGSTLDYARFFRGRREGPNRITEADAQARSLLARAKGRAGWRIGQDASDGLYSAFGSGKVNEAQAVAIARTAPGDEGLQRVGLQYALSGQPAEFIENMMKAVKSRAAEGAPPVEGDLFGGNDETIKAAEAQAAVATRLQREIRQRIAAVSGASKRPEVARELGVDVRDPEGVRRAIGELQNELGRWESWYLHPDLVAKTKGEPAPAAGIPVSPVPEDVPVSAQARPTISQPAAEPSMFPPGVAEQGPPYDASKNPFAATPEEHAAERARAGPTGLGTRLARPEARRQQPPVGHPAVDEVLEALRSTEPLPARAANLSLSAITSEADVQRVLHATAEAEAGFPDGVHQVPTAETLRRAQESGLSPDELALVARQAQTNPDAALRAGLLMRAGARDVWTAARAAREAPGPETHAQLALAISRLAAIQNTYSGLGNAAGRFLNVFGQLRRIGAEHEATMKIVERAGGAGNLDAIADVLGSLESPEQVVATARNLVPSTRLGKAGFYLLKTGDWIRTAWINGLVSGPHTHSVTMSSNVLLGSLTEAEHAGAIPVGMIRRALTKDQAPRVTVTEMQARLAHPVLDVLDSLKIAKAALLSGESRYGNWALDQPLPKAEGARAARWAANIVTSPMRALVTESEFFRATSYAHELRGLATRKALSMGPAAPKEFAERVQAILESPPEEMIEAARQRALEVDAATKLRGNLATMEDLARSIPGAWVLIPFFRVSVNLGRHVLLRTPAGLAMKSVRAEIAAGGARADLAISRMALGSGIALTAFLLARQGKINGFGPTDPAKRKVWLEQGNLPYSWRFGDTSIDFARMEPVGSLFGIAADYAAVAEHASEMEQNQIVSALTLGVVRNLINKTFLTNLHEALNGIYDPARSGAGFVRSLAGSVVPNIVNEAGRIADPNLREARTVVDAIRARIPKIEALGIEGREGLPVRRGPLGEPRISQPGSVGSRALQAISPFYRSTMKHDPVIDQMVELGMGVGNPAEKVDDVPMTPAERERFLVQSGRYAREELDIVVKQRSFGKLPPDERRDSIESAIRAGREAARDDLRLQRMLHRPSGSRPVLSLEGFEPDQSSAPPEVTGILQ